MSILPSAAVSSCRCSSCGDDRRKPVADLLRLNMESPSCQIFLSTTLFQCRMRAKSVSNIRIVTLGPSEFRDLAACRAVFRNSESAKLSHAIAAWYSTLVAWRPPGRNATTLGRPEDSATRRWCGRLGDQLIAESRPKSHFRRGV